MTDTPFPAVPDLLLRKLNEMYPERCPDEGWSERRIWIEVGKRQVVRHLNRVAEDQAGDALTTPPRM